MLDATLMQRVYWLENAVAHELVRSLANTLIPGLKTAIEAEAARICKHYECGDDPFAKDACERLLVTEVAEFLCQDWLEDVQQIVQMHQMTKKHVFFSMQPEMDDPQKE